MRDGRGQPSTTLTLGVVAFAAATIKFVLGGFGWVPDMSGTDYAAVLTVVMAGWRWKKHSEGRWDGDDSTDQ